MSACAQQKPRLFNRVVEIHTLLCSSYEIERALINQVAEVARIGLQRNSDEVVLGHAEDSSFGRLNTYDAIRKTRYSYLVADRVARREEFICYISANVSHTHLSVVFRISKEPPVRYVQIINVRHVRGRAVNRNVFDNLRAALDLRARGVCACA